MDRFCDILKLSHGSPDSEISERIIYHCKQFLEIQNISKREEFTDYSDFIFQTLSDCRDFVGTSKGERNFIEIIPKIEMAEWLLVVYIYNP